MIETLTNELELVARSTTEPSAFAAVYDHYLPRLYKYMRYRVSDINEAEELTSLTFERVLTKISSYRPERGTFANWLFAIANNTFVDYLRAKKRRTHVSLEAIILYRAMQRLRSELVRQLFLKYPGLPIIRL